ncbi:MAG TPA: EAL domain-containing protein [Steroidobacteraceae bacterium]|nr:EAL domain-containing protein [Steroidobacteraceae bacterium]
MKREVRLLLVEDVPTDAELEIRELKRAGLHVVHRVVETEPAYREALRDFKPDLIISDFSMPHFDGMLALEIAREHVPDLPFIFVSGTIGEEYAIRALKSGATDYVLKNNLVRLPPAVERALQEAELQLARRKAERDVQHQRVFLRQVIDLDRNLIFARDREGRFTLVNESYAAFFGRSVEDCLSRTYADINSRSDRLAEIRKSDLEIMDTLREALLPDEPIIDANGKVRWFQVVKRPLVSADGRANMVLGVATEITQRKMHEDRIARLSRVHAVLSGINSAIVHIRDRQKLFDEACRIAVEDGGFGIAWIGLLDRGTLDITPVASAGIEAGSFIAKSGNTARPDSPLGQGFVGRAIREKRAAYSNDITREQTRGGERRKEAIRRGYRSMIALPLLVENEAEGSLSLFAQEPGFFDDEELKLLTELANDVSFALEHIAGQERIEKLSRVRAFLGGTNAAIVRIRDREGLLKETCRLASEEGRFELVWIATIDSDKQEVRPVAWTGFSAESARSVDWANINATQGTIREAIRTRKPVVRNDIVTELSSGKLRQEALARGCGSTVCVPLEVDGKLVAVIVLFATGRGFFVEDEIALLGDVASNVSFALESIARQEKIERLSRIREVLGEMNAAIVRIHERQQLFDEACRIALERGKFAMSWIGLLDEPTKTVKPVAKSGRDQGYLERLNLSIDPNITSNLALAVEAIGRGAPVICNDIATDGRMRPWRAAALERGYRANVMLPLMVEERALGVFALYASEAGFFDDEEMRLLVELAGDIGFALQTIEKQEKLDYLSYYDPLTGLPNRKLFHDRVDQALQSQRASGYMAALLILDLQRFGIINDTYGRQAGDALLKLVSQRLEGALGDRDYLARLEADTFAAILLGVNHEANVAHVLEQQILNALRQPFVIDGAEIRLAAQTGIALFPGDGDDAVTLFRNAEAALAKAKNAGDAYLFYAPQMNARVADQLKLENDLRNAIAHEQYVLHYQPRIDLASGKIVGMEALIRWKHPERGMVSPGEFIPVLEETGMILDVGRWALRRAALQHAAWCGMGRVPPRIAVNVSPAQLRRKDFVDHVRDALASVDRAAERVDLEITESMLMEDISGSIDKLKTLQSAGFKVALDDFGTGYSSLSYLARLPIDSLKIDRSFVQQMAKGPERLAIVSTVISLARALNLKVVAEGVETEEQANLLRLLRCDEAQGYLFGRPVPPEEIEPLIA